MNDPAEQRIETYSRIDLQFKANSCGLIVHKVYDSNCNAMYQMIRNDEILAKLGHKDALVWLDGYTARRNAPHSTKPGK